MDNTLWVDALPFPHSTLKKGITIELLSLIQATGPVEYPVPISPPVNSYQLSKGCLYIAHTKSDSLPP